MGNQGNVRLEKVVFPREHQLVFQCKTVSPENIQRSNIIWTDHVILKIVNVYMHTTRSRKKTEATNFKESRKDLEGAREREKC